MDVNEVLDTQVMRTIDEYKKQMRAKIIKTKLSL